MRILTLSMDTLAPDLIKWICERLSHNERLSLRAVNKRYLAEVTPCLSSRNISCSFDFDDVAIITSRFTSLFLSLPKSIEWISVYKSKRMDIYVMKYRYLYRYFVLYNDSMRNQSFTIALYLYSNCDVYGRFYRDDLQKVVDAFVGKSYGKLGKISLETVNELLIKQGCRVIC